MILKNLRAILIACAALCVAFFVWQYIGSRVEAKTSQAASAEAQRAAVAAVATLQTTTKAHEAGEKAVVHRDSAKAAIAADRETATKITKEVPDAWADQPLPAPVRCSLRAAAGLRLEPPCAAPAAPGNPVQ